MTANTLTANLRMELERTNNNFAHYMQSKEDWLAQQESSYAQQYEECVHTLTALEQTELSLEEARAQNDEIKKQQQADIDRYTNLASRIQAQCVDLRKQLHTAEVEEERETQRYEQANTQLAQHQAKLEHHFNDLTQGVRLYMSLGKRIMNSRYLQNHLRGTIYRFGIHEDGERGHPICIHPD
jgi:chromosome segregation ATPase